MWSNSSAPSASPRSSRPPPDSSPLDSITAVALLDSNLLDGSATLLIDFDARVHWASPVAGDTLKANSCLELSEGILRGMTRHSDRLFQKLLANVRSDGLSEQLLATAPKAPLQLFARARVATTNGSKLVILTIRKLDEPAPTIPDLTELYGLTNAEQHILQMMIEGGSVADIARHLGKSILTVRTHVKHIHCKMNVGTKEQLFSAVLKLMIR